MTICTLRLPGSLWHSPLHLCTLASLWFVLLWNIQPAHASPFTIQPIGNLVNTTISDVGVELPKTSQGPGGLYPADLISITYTDKSTGKPVTTTKRISILTGGLRFLINAKPGSITVTNLSEPTVPAAVASLNSFDPPSNVVVSAFTVAPGSALTFAGNSFALTGGFTAVDTSVSYDPTSPLYALEQGSVTFANILGTGAAGTVQLVLTSPAVYSLDLSSIWAQTLGSDGIPPLGLSTPTGINLAGVLYFNSTAIPFTGTFSGVTTFFDDGTTMESGTLDLSTAAGLVTGSLSASATPELVPEPNSLTLFSMGLTGLAFALKKSDRTH